MSELIFWGYQAKELRLLEWDWVGSVLAFSAKCTGSVFWFFFLKKKTQVLSGAFDFCVISVNCTVACLWHTSRFLDLKEFKKEWFGACVQDRWTSHGSFVLPFLSFAACIATKRKPERLRSCLTLFQNCGAFVRLCLVCVLQRQLAFHCVSPHQ